MGIYEINKELGLYMMIPDKRLSDVDPRSIPTYEITPIEFHLPEVRKPSGKPGMIQVWSEGYAATGESATASFMGEVEADSFDEACIKVCGDRLDKNDDGTYRRISYYGEKAGQIGPYCIWACALYDNEADARGGFG